MPPASSPLPLPFVGVAVALHDRFVDVGAASGGGSGSSRLPGCCCVAELEFTALLCNRCCAACHFRTRAELCSAIFCCRLPACV